MSTVSFAVFHKLRQIEYSGTSVHEFNSFLETVRYPKYS
jgi:hypothetical protein